MHLITRKHASLVFLCFALLGNASLRFQVVENLLAKRTVIESKVSAYASGANDNNVSSTIQLRKDVNSLDKRTATDVVPLSHFEPVKCPNGWRTRQSRCRHDRSPQSYELICLSGPSRINAYQKIILPSTCPKEFDICSSSGENIYCTDSAGGMKIDSDPSTSVTRKYIQDIPPRTDSREMVTVNVLLTDPDCTRPMYAKSLSLSVSKNLGSISNTASASVIDQVQCTDCFNLEIAVPPNAESITVQCILAPGGTERLIFIPIFSHS